MNNIELETKIKEIVNIDNYFDMILAINDFEKEYKTSDFYKVTKKSLVEVVKEYKVNSLFSTTNWIEKLQKLIDSLSVEKITNVLEQIGTTFENENTEIMDSLKSFKDLMKN